MNHVKFPSIEQYKNTVKSVQKYMLAKGIDSYEPVQYLGVEKLHGTNASFNKDVDGNYCFQSRERVLSIQSDNAGFCIWGEKNIDAFKELADLFSKQNVIIYGEWAGTGIQKGVALNQLPKRFYVFAVKVDDRWLALEKVQFAFTKFNHDEIKLISNIVTPFSITIDFAKPQDYVEQLESLTKQVEEKSPLALYYGVEGVGEGIVWTPVDEDKLQVSDLWFKVKGEKHSISKTTTGAKTSAVDLTGYAEAVETFVTEARLERGLVALQEMGKELDVKATGDFIRWIMNDIIREERETIIENGFEIKAMGGMIASKARKFYMEKV